MPTCTWNEEPKPLDCIPDYISQKPQRALPFPVSSVFVWVERGIRLLLGFGGKYSLVFLWLFCAELCSSAFPARSRMAAARQGHRPVCSSFPRGAGWGRSELGGRASGRAVRAVVAVERREPWCPSRPGIESPTRLSTPVGESAWVAHSQSLA